MTSRPRIFRPLLAGFGFTAFALIGLQQSGAQAFRGHNTNAPVDYQADRIELQDKQNRVVLAGNVDITQTDLRLRAARTTVAYTNNGSMQIQRIDATGGVFVTRGTDTARGNAAVYDFGRKVITMSGNVALNQNGNTLNGGRLVIDLNTGISSVDGRGTGGGSSSGGGGRVSGTFTVNKKN
jgi:lipopolysaccharide export system protein LptA